LYDTRKFGLGLGLGYGTQSLKQERAPLFYGIIALPQALGSSHRSIWPMDGRKGGVWWPKGFRLQLPAASGCRWRTWSRWGNDGSTQRSTGALRVHGPGIVSVGRCALPRSSRGAAGARRASIVPAVNRVSYIDMNRMIYHETQSGRKSCHGSCRMV